MVRPNTLPGSGTSGDESGRVGCVSVVMAFIAFFSGPVRLRHAVCLNAGHFLQETKDAIF